MSDDRNLVENHVAEIRRKAEDAKNRQASNPIRKTLVTRYQYYTELADAIEALYIGDRT